MAKKKSKQKSVFVFSKVRFIIFVIFAAVLGVSMLFSTQIENYYQRMVGNVNVVQSTEIRDNSKLSVHYVNVGQGDCIMINLPDDKNVIIDAGQKNGSNPIYSGQTESNDKAITQHVIDYAKTNIIQEGQKFDYMVLTHAHEDHVSILDNVLDEFDVDTIVRSPEFYQSDKDATLTAKELAFANANGVTLKDNYNKVSTGVMREFLNKAYAEVDNGATMLVTSDSIQWTGADIDGNNYEIKFYTINETEYYNPTDSGLKNNPNNYSPLIVLTYNGTTMAFTGDGEKKSEELILAKYGSSLPNVDIMDLAHHGSKTGNIQTFIQALDPEYAIVSVGDASIYGLPDEEVYERLKTHDAEIANRIFETIKYGDIVIGLNYTPSAEAEGDTLASTGNMAIGISSGEYIPETTIKWWYIALGLIVLCAILLFLKPSSSKKVLKKISK